MTARQWALIAVLSLFWGGSFFFNAIARPEVPTFTLVLLRVGGGALILILAALTLGHPVPRTGREWRDFAVMGALANAIPFVLIVFAQTRITSGMASVLNASAPLWTAMIAHAFTSDDKLTPQRGWGVAIGITGVATLVGPAALQAKGADTLGMLAVIAATMSYGFAGLWGRRFKEVPPIVMSAAQLVCSTALLIPFAVVLEHPWDQAVPSLPALAAIAALAVVSTALGFLIFFQIMAEAGATNAMMVTLLVPMSATLLGVLVLHEPLTTQQLAGGLLIGAALLIIDGRLWRFIQRQRA